MSEKTDAKKVSDSGGKSEKQLKSGEKYINFFFFLLLKSEVNITFDCFFFYRRHVTYIFFFFFSFGNIYGLNPRFYDLIYQQILY